MKIWQLPFVLLLYVLLTSLQMLFGYFAGIIPIGMITVPVALLTVAFAASPNKTRSYSMWGPSDSMEEWIMVRLLFFFILLPIGIGAAADHYQWVDLSTLGDFTARILLRSKGS